MPKDSKKVKVAVTFSKRELDEFYLIAEKQGLSLEEYFEKAIEEICIEMKSLEATPTKFNEYIERIAKKSMLVV